MFNCIQGSEEWVKLRLGKVTASKFSAVMAQAKDKSKGRVTRNKYRDDLVAEIMEQRPKVSYFDKNMEAGQDKEPDAREYYESLMTCKVDQVGFITMNDYVGCSPDSIIGKNGGIELKAPISTTHIRYLKNPDALVEDYYWQLQGNLYVTKRVWWDIMSYRPENLYRKHCYKRVYRNEEDIKELAVEIQMIVTEIQDEFKKLTVREF